MARLVNIPSFLLVSLALKERWSAAGLLQPRRSAWKYLTYYHRFQAVRSKNKRWTTKHDREHGRPVEWQICLEDRLVTTARPDASHSRVVFGCAFPIDYLSGRDETGGKGWESVCAAEVFSNLAGCGQLDRRFEFLLTARLKFQPLKIEGNKRFGFSKQPRRVVFFSRPFLIFPVPVPSSRPHLGSDRLWYDSKCDYVKIFYSKFPPQRWFSDESAGFTAVLGTAWFTWLGLFLDRDDGVLPDLKSAI